MPPLRLGILGGTFDPIHLGHLRLAEEARAKLGLDRVLLVPAAAQPLKAQGLAAGAEDRLAMARLAAAPFPWIEVSDIEVRRPPPSYTIDTLRAIRAERQDAELFFVIGADAARDLPRWFQVGELLRLATFVVATRPGFELVAPPPLRDRLRTLEIEALPISSTEVRRLLHAGGDVSRLLPAPVLAYIRERGLYGARRPA